MTRFIPRGPALALFLSSSLAAAQSLGRPTLFEEHFDMGTGAVSAPAWGCNAPIPIGTNGWLVGNHRPNFPGTNTNTVQFAGGEARIFSFNNSATGGYVNLQHPIVTDTLHWRLTTRVKVDLAFDDRPVPSLYTTMAPNPTEPCNPFPDGDPAGPHGWLVDAGQMLTLRDGTGLLASGYIVPADGSYHTVELISRPSGSELRAWADGDVRPFKPLVQGQSLGPVMQLLFPGPNFRNFDYSVDFVLLERLPELEGDPVPALKTFIDQEFDAAACNHVAPSWACNPPIQTCLPRWELGNSRPDFMATNMNNLSIGGGAARMWSTDNSATGGYLAFYRTVPEEPMSWRLRVRVKVDSPHPGRTLPQCYVDIEQDPGAPCHLFPYDPGLTKGWHVDDADRLLLLDGSGAQIDSGYLIPDDGSYHHVEVTSTPIGSELRAWPDGGARPAAPLVLGISLGPARRVHFGGPNAVNFDYTVDSVLLTEVE